jgi:hypothetical protein
MDGMGVAIAAANGVDINARNKDAVASRRRAGHFALMAGFLPKFPLWGRTLRFNK